MTSITYILLAIFLLSMVWIGWRAGRVPDETRGENFLIANRAAAGILVAIGVVMSWVDATSFGFVGGMGYDVGWGVAPYVLGAVLTFLWLAVLAPKIRTIGAQGGMYMMSDLIRQKFSRRAGLVAGVAIHLYFAFWMLIQFIVGPQVIQAILGISVITTSVVMGSVTLIYLLLGGYRSQMYTDLAQFGLFAALAVVFIGAFIPSAPQWVAPAASFGSLGPSTWIAFFIASVASTIAAPDVWQRIYSARSERDARFSMILCFVLMSVVYAVFASLGMIVKHFGWAASSNDVSAAIFQHLVPQWFLPVAIVIFFAIIMSTIATTLFGASLAVSNDILFGYGFISRERIPFWQRIVMVAVLIFGVVVTVSNLSIISVVSYALAACLVPLPIVLLILYSVKISERGAFISMLLSLATFIAGLVFGLLNGFGLLWPLGVGVGSLIISELLIRPKKVPAN